jgi:SulP family sulfate permease
MPDGSATAHIYRSKIVTVLVEGYSLDCFRRDMLAALTVAIVALPLSMAIAVASGVSPERGLYAAVIGGFLVSALGGSRYQIGGPAGAFIVLVAATATKFGLEGLLLTVFLSGFMLTLIGLLRLGSLIRYIPHAVTVGFTCGIAVMIFASQLKDLGGLKLPGAEPGQLLPKLAMLGQALPTLSPAAFAVGAGSATLIFLLRRLLPNWPGMLIAVGLASVVAWMFHLPVETVGSHFGQLPDGVPPPRLPSFSTSSVLDVLPAALSFTLLGAVESLLSAKVADGMTGRKHRYNMEVVAQGVANVASAICGGISVTGTIARTATNIRAGACSPISGIGHGRLYPGFHVGRRTVGELHPLVDVGRCTSGGLLEYGGEGRFPSPASRLARCQRADGRLRPYADRGPYLRYHRGMHAGRGVRDLRPSQAATTSAFLKNARVC